LGILDEIWSDGKGNERNEEGRRERKRVKKKKVDPRDLFLSSLRTFFENGGRGSSASAKQLQATSS